MRKGFAKRSDFEIRIRQLRTAPPQWSAAGNESTTRCSSIRIFTHFYHLVSLKVVNMEAAKEGAVVAEGFPQPSVSEIPDY
jgi:hypothetical protein